MKTTLAALFSIALLATACSSDKQEQRQDPAKQETKQDATQASFYCPMKCEGEKTYPETGSCPVCGMDLVETKMDAETDMHEGQNHEGHNH